MSSRWIAVDWGTSRVRAFWMDDRNEIIDRAQSDRGMAQLRRDDFEDALLDLIGPWLGDQPAAQALVLASGMVGARSGWVEAPYAPVPSPPLDPTRFASAPARDPRLTVWIAHGLAQAEPPEVMRGEETQIAGFLRAEPEFDGVVCLPGTHSKWAKVAHGRILSFRTVMTGELFALLSEASVLRHTLVLSGDDEPGPNSRGDAAFLSAAEEALDAPERVLLELFGVRARALLEDHDPVLGRSRLSGLLIGAEIAAARGLWAGRPVALIGAPGLAERYRRVLERAGASCRAFDVETATLGGLSSVRGVLATMQAGGC